MKLKFAILYLLTATFGAGYAQDKKDYTQYVNPLIGSAGHGHVFVGANVPFGAVQVGPNNITQGWDWCSGYNYSDSTIIGFAQTHLSGTGIGDLGDISLMPVTGDVKPVKGKLGQPETGYYSLFSHKDEEAKAGYYAVTLKRYNIRARLTATSRVAFHDYTFPKSGDARIIIDLENGIGWDRPMQTYIKQINETTIEGYRFSKGWANDQRIYFTAVFSKPIKSLRLYEGETLQQGKQFTGVRTKGVVLFDAVNDRETIQVKIGISPVSTENALLNMNAELNHWNFDQVYAQAKAAWNKELSRLDVQTLNDSQQRTFYTAYYHTMIAPSVFNDVNGDYWGTDKKVHKKAGFTNYTTFSLWDTYRAAQPLMTITHPDKVSDMMNTMLAIYKQQGKLPVWHLMGNETNTMVGSPAIPVMADAILKGFKGFNVNEAYNAMKQSQFYRDSDLVTIKDKGFLAADKSVESVSKALEYAIADWSIAQVAKKLGKTADYAYWSKRGEAYKLYFDKQTGFMRGKLSDGSWRRPFDPFESVHRKNDYTEGNAWQYLWLVPQDVEGLIALLGGDKGFNDKLDALFVAEGHLGADASPDISGLIGQYAHGNEPSHHIPYMYAFSGQPYKTAEKVRFILNNMYSDKMDGLCGNEDVGQMSAWYVFSALGFYPENPSNGMFVFGSPIINQAVIHLPANKQFEIKAANNSPENKYIQSIELNGKPYSKSYIMYKDIMQGGKLLIKMGKEPSKTWGIKKADRPYSVVIK